MSRINDKHYRCPRCGKVFECFKSQGSGYRDTGYCKDCNNELLRKYDRERGMSAWGSKEHIEKLSGEYSSQWKGGQHIDVDNAGNKRMMICVGGGKYLPRSRVVMEKVLGRKLKPSEVVHHKNGDTLDDRPENLQLFKNRSEHTRFHRNKEAKQKEVCG